MTTYCYRTPSGEVVEREFAAGKAPCGVEVDGEIARRDYRAELKGTPARAGWPIVCVASGVNAEDAGKLRDTFDQLGVPTEVTKDGDPVYRDARHRKRALRVRGLHDRLGYY